MFVKIYVFSCLWSRPYADISHCTDENLRSHTFSVFLVGNSASYVCVVVSFNDYSLCLCRARDFIAAFSGHVVTLCTLLEQCVEINGEEELLRLDDKYSYPQITQALAALDPYSRLWNSVVQFEAHSERWMDGPINDLKPEDIEEEVSA